VPLQVAQGLCSYFVPAVSSHCFKPPWMLVPENSECYVVRDAQRRDRGMALLS
jgi:hypothetical protein